jgi:ABC-2 type transport system ATP-binding protein
MRASAQAVLETGERARLEGLVKRFGGKTALDGISLSVRRGEVYGFIGPNGAGKTTTMRILVGLIGFDAGSCLVGEGEGAASLGGARGGVAHFSRARGRRAAAKGARRDLGYLPEEPVFAEYLTGREYLAMLAATMALPRPRDTTEGLLERLSLVEAADRRVSGYSRGMRQRLGLACALLGDPDFLVLDEPSSALDPEGRRAVVDLVLSLKAEGKTVFLSTHILSDIERICDRVALLDAGRILLEGTMGELLERGAARRVDLLLSRPLSEAERLALEGLPFVEALELEEGGRAVSLLEGPGGEDRRRVDLVRKLGELGLPLLSLNPRRMTLEELFLGKVAQHV